MRLALDTNAYVRMTRGDRTIADRVEAADAVYVPFPVLGELRAGFLGGNRLQHNEKDLTKFLNSSEVEILYADEQTTHHFARIAVQLRKQGTPIPANDMWIAALVVQHDLILCSGDRHFDHLPQLLRA